MHGNERVLDASKIPSGTLGSRAATTEAAHSKAKRSAEEREGAIFSAKLRVKEEKGTGFVCCSERAGLGVEVKWMKLHLFL